MPRPNATYTERIVGPGKFDGSIVEPMDGPINPSSPNEGYNAHVVEIPSYGSLYPNIFECFPPSLVKLHDIWKKIQCNLATIISSFETPFYIIITLGAEGVGKGTLKGESFVLPVAVFIRSRNDFYIIPIV